MSQILNPVRAATSRPTVTLREFGSYEEAQQLVDRLSDVGFRIEQVRIVGTGLRSIEQVTGRLTKGRAAVFGLVAHWTTRGRRDFSSIRNLEARSYAVEVEAGYEDEAARVAGIA
jgi:hypothetical protein